MYLVNPDNSHDSANFSSTVDPRTVNPNVLPSSANNVDAARGILDTAGSKYLIASGGGRINRKKINKISRKYKMRRHSRSHRHKRRSTHRGRSSTHRRRSTHRRSTHRRRSTLRGRTLRGGYSQYQNNQPFDMGYSLGGKLSPSLVGMANPPPFKAYNNVIDNFNDYTKTGSISRGH